MENYLFGGEASAGQDVLNQLGQLKIELLRSKATSDVVLYTSTAKTVPTKILTRKPAV